jgi:hypothetical protein
MTDLDKFAMASLPMAFKFYKSAIESDGEKIEFEDDDDDSLPSIDLKIIADYAYLMAKAMQNSKDKMADQSWIDGHDHFISALMTPKGEKQ